MSCDPLSYYVLATHGEEICRQFFGELRRHVPGPGGDAINHAEQLIQQGLQQRREEGERKGRIGGRVGTIAELLRGLPMTSNPTPDARSGASPATYDTAQSLRGQVERVPVGPILFIDGHCVLCQRAAQWVLRHDRRGRVALAALQGRTAHRLLPAALCEKPAPAGRTGIVRRPAPADQPAAAGAGSLVWREVDGRIRVRSAAVLAVAVALGGWYRAGATLLWLVPARLRDALYLALARRRRWFGTTDRCRLPTASHGNRLLD